MTNKTKTYLVGLILLSPLFIFGQNPCSVHKCAHNRITALQRRSLASDELKTQMNRYDVTFYKLDVNLERTSAYISGNATIQAKSTVTALDTVAFELHDNMQIDSIKINGIPVSYDRNNHGIYAYPSTPIPAGQFVTAQIFYKGDAAQGGSAAIGDGLSSRASQTWGNRVTWSLSQPYSAYEWWPCKQVLADKADSVHVFVTTDSSNKVGSNGILTAVVNLPNGKRRYEWKSRYPINYYLISVAVAQYIDYSFYANIPGVPPVLVQNYIYNNPQTLPNFQQDIDETDDMMILLSQRFGTYPFWREKYGHCMAPFAGGMEHQTMTTQGFFERTLTAHELGHQWFGDNVTCASWQ
ncbi:MAG: hypothetical protein NZ108_05885, partial [Bacteroidia bacterium]|nr:hypothetical protein [Bacteroidia bacterium]